MNRETMIFNFHKIVMTGYARILIRYDLEMEERFPKGAKILIANHPTTTDPFLLPLLCEDGLSILVTQAAFEVPGLGWALRRGGHIPVPDPGPGSGERIIRAAVDKLDAGQAVAVFPEGALSPEVGQFGALKTGAARIALLSGAPVYPIGIHLSRRAYVSFRFRDQQGRLAARGDYFVTVGRPLVFHGDAQDRDLVHAVTHQMMAAILTQTAESALRMRASYLQRVPELMVNAANPAGF